jgi:competence protein ComEC
MWLGMLTGIAGQLPLIPVEPLNRLDSLCLAYIAQTAHWLAAPRWALLSVHLRSAWAVLAASLALVLAMELLLRGLQRWRARRELRSETRSLRSRILWDVSARSPGGPAAAAVAAIGIAVAIAVGAGGLPFVSGSGASEGPARLVVRVLDVGQGDSILLDPPGADPVLVDTGPPGDHVEDRLRDLGVSRLAAVVISHDQSDHSGDLAQILGAVDVGRVVYGRDDARLRAAALGAGARPFQLAEGSDLDAGGLRLSALWPPRELEGEAGEDPNLLCLVLLARWRHFTMLLTGDAEAEAVPIDPGPIDVLKVAHHGSADAGLAELLDRSVPKLAVISVGAGNRYGHPTQRTLTELRMHSVPTLRTDRDGEVAFEADGSRWTVEPAGG